VRGWRVIAAVMLVRPPPPPLPPPTSTTVCGEEWINWTTLCPCCRRDASDEPIDLQEMIKLEPIRVRRYPRAGITGGSCSDCE